MAAAVACDGPQEDAKSLRTDPAESVDSDTTPQVPSDLRVAIESPDSARVGESIQIALTLSNVGHDSAMVSLGYVANQPRVRVTLHDGAGKLVWDSRESAMAGGRPAGQEVQQVLAHGEYLRAEVAWNGRDLQDRVVPAGDYLIGGSLFTLGRPLNAAPRPLRVLSGS